MPEAIASTKGSPAFQTFRRHRLFPIFLIKFYHDLKKFSISVGLGVGQEVQPKKKRLRFLS
jgi:hypothetical protein